jgi:3-oxoacyl-[acyl-carrier protein] reductase
MDISLEGKRALVGGSTQGIGNATVMLMASLGAEIILVARNEAKLKETLSALPKNHQQNHRYAVADFTRPHEMETSVKEVIRATGPVHILVNNTGGPPSGLLLEAQEEAFRQAFDMHLICNQILARLVVPGMKEAHYGRIINIISTSVKQPLPNLGVSNTIRGAVANWSKTLANELGPFQITVNNVLPGATRTSRLVELARKKGAETEEEIEGIIREMGQKSPMNRVAEPEEVANAVVFLASPAASYINGINIPVDGGRTGCL